MGLSKRLEWDYEKQKYILVKKAKISKYGMGMAVSSFLERTKTFVVFTEGFGSQTTTGGGEINGAWGAGDWVPIGNGEKYKVQKYSVIWISADFKNSPAAIAMLLAHEVGHGLGDEYRYNFPLPYDDPEALKKPPYIYFPNSDADDDRLWCYPFEGMMAEELGLTTEKAMDLVIRNSTQFEEGAANWYKEIVGGINFTFPEFYRKLRMEYCMERKQSYLSRPHYCGMRTKHFNEYGFCDRQTYVKPCYQWPKHLEGWLAPDKKPDN